MATKVFWQRIGWWFIAASVTFLFFVIMVQVVYGRIYDYERQTLLGRERLFGNETDEFRPVGGRAEITASAIFENGVHLESLEENAMAVAIYQFEEIDKNASSLAIIIAYRGSGKVFIVQDENSGITFELPGDQERQTLYLAANYIADDGTVEIHVITDSNKKLDIQFIELESLRYKPEIRVIERYEYLPTEWPRTIYYYYYRGPIYTIVRPYEYVVYDGWWESDWYIGWRAGFVVRTYPVYRYCHRSERRIIHVYQDPPEQVIIRELPNSREPVQYIETRRRRPEASRSRLDNMPERRIQKQRVESKPGTTENSRVQIRYRPDISTEWQTITPSRTPTPSETRIKQRREEAPKASPAQRETSSRAVIKQRREEPRVYPVPAPAQKRETVIKQRRAESSSPAPAKTTSADDEEENRKKRRR